jgi:hypothetical protein
MKCHACNGMLGGDEARSTSHMESGGSSRARSSVTWPFTNKIMGIAAMMVSPVPRRLMRKKMKAPLTRIAANMPMRFASGDTQEVFPHALHVTGVPHLPPM